jgi:hypothetical protein
MSLLQTLASRRTISKKEAENQGPRWLYDLHTCIMAHSHSFSLSLSLSPPPLSLLHAHLKKSGRPGLVVYIINPSTREAEVGGSL